MKIFTFILLIIITFHLNAQWSHSSNGLPQTFGFTNGVNNIASGGGALYVALNQQLFRSTDEGANWIDITSKFPSNSRFTIMNGNDTRIFVSLDTLSNNNVRTGRFFYSSNMGENWIEPGIFASSSTFGSLAVEGNLVYVASANLYRSTDGGTTFTQVQTSLPDRGTSLAIVGNDLYLTRQFNTSRSTDNGVTWSNLPNITGSFSLISQANALYAGTSPVVKKSTDNGATWDNLGTGYPSGGYDTPFLFIHQGTLLASVYKGGFSEGLYRLIAGTNQWTAYHDGFPATPKVGNLVLHNGYLYAATSGFAFGQNGGVYKRPLSELLTSVNEDLTHVSQYQLKQNYPNPFNPTTAISYSIKGSQFVSLKVFDVLGKEIAVLVNEEKAEGNYTVHFNSSDLTTSVYFFSLSAGNFSETKKMILLK
jgi:photosystem II stability/assembly factor-like uncharacterized protein